MPRWAAAFGLFVPPAARAARAIPHGQNRRPPAHAPAGNLPNCRIALSIAPAAAIANTPKKMNALECLSTVAATLHPRAKDELDKLCEKLLHAAPEIQLSVLRKGAGTYGGLDHLCHKYGTATTADIYAALLKAMDGGLAMKADTSP